VHFAVVLFSASLVRQLVVSFIRLRTWLQHLLDVCLLVCRLTPSIGSALLHVSSSSFEYFVTSVVIKTDALCLIVSQCVVIKKLFSVH